MGVGSRGVGEARPLRLFVAVDIPHDVRDALAEAAAPLRAVVPGARWTPPAGWHVTLKFLGRTFPAQLEFVEHALVRVAREHRAVATAVSGLGVFPNPRRARVLWAGLDDPERRFPAMSFSLDQELRQEFDPEKKEAVPHVTLARLDPPARLDGGVLDTRIRSRPFVIDRLVLYRSHLRRPGPHYETLREFPLSSQ